MQQLTKEQAIILTGFTGIAMVQNTSDFLDFLPSLK